jgi:uncharacterized membrane protein
MSEMKPLKISLEAKERFMWLLLFMGIFTATFAVASEIDLPQETTEVLKDQMVEKLQTAIDNQDNSFIFLNNVFLGLVMFIPFVGVVFGIGSAFATGITVASFNLDVPAYLILYATPFGFIELVSYSIAMSRSLYLVKRRKFLRKELRPTLIEILIVVGLLFIGGIVESSMLGIL